MNLAINCLMLYLKVGDLVTYVVLAISFIVYSIYVHRYAVTFS